MTKVLPDRGLVGKRRNDWQWGTVSKMLGTLAVAALLIFSGCAQPVSPTSTTNTSPKISTTTSTVMTATTAVPTTTTSVSTAAKPTTATTAATPKPTTSAGPYGKLSIAVPSFGGDSFYPPPEIPATVWTILSPMFDFLVRLRASDMELSPGVLDRWEMARDGLSWTYYVHQGIKFHNGEDLKADDVKFTLDAYAAKDAYTSDLKSALSRTEAINDYTVRVYTKGPALDLPAFSTFYAPCRGLVIPKDYVEQKGVTYFAKNPVGSGPFKFIRYIPGDSVEYEAVSNHWRQTPAFRNLTLVLVPEEATRVAALKTGEIDVTELGEEATQQLSSAGYKTFITQLNFSSIMITGAYLKAAAGMPVSDIRVRQALSLAINRDEIIKTFFKGVATPAGPPYLTEDTRDIDVAKWMDYASKVLNRYDLDKAKQLLKDAGYPNGFNIKLWTYPMSAAEYLPNLAQIIQAYWAKTGVKAEIVPADQATYFTFRNTLKNPTPNAIGQASTFRSDGYPFARRTLTAPFDTRRDWALLGTTMPEVDKLFDATEFESDPFIRRTLFDKIITLVADTYVVIMIARVPGRGVMGPKVDIDYPKPSISASLYADIAKHR